MPVVNRIADLAPTVAEWRRDIHAHPEMLFDTHRTSALVADKLRGFGCDEVVTGIGRTGVVGVIRGRDTGSGRVIGLRADMDALPMTEATGLPHASTIPGAMHACGHDGHTAMLLGAAQYLAETRNFDGTAVVIFQPAEEGGGGGREMVEDGLMDRFGIQEVYGLHNMPGLPVGDFAVRPGAAARRLRHDHHRGDRPRRPRRAAAQRHRPGGRRERDRAGAAVDRRPQRRPAEGRRGLGHQLPHRDRRLQRHPRARRAARHRPLARSRGAGPDRGPDDRARRGDGAGLRRRGAARPTSATTRSRSTPPPRPTSPPASPPRWSATPASTPTRRR